MFKAIKTAAIVAASIACTAFVVSHASADTIFYSNDNGRVGGVILDSGPVCVAQLGGNFYVQAAPGIVGVYDGNNDVFVPAQTDEHFATITYVLEESGLYADFIACIDRFGELA